MPQPWEKILIYTSLSGLAQEKTKKTRAEARV
jgi:hypothetical protein